MDSFYDAPRRPPQPIPRETFSATPVVPEISVLCPSNNTKNAFTPYNQWKKDAVPNNFLLANKENINQHFQSTQNNSILKKQVRFESPVLQQQRPLESNAQFLNKADSHGYSKNDIDPKLMHDQGRPVSNFEQMYMANIPSRQLDLSVIDLPKRIPPNEDKKNLDDNLFCKETRPVENQQPKTYREFLNGQKIENKITLNDSVTDIFNYKNNSPKVRHNSHKVGVEADKNLNNQYSPISGSNAHEPNIAELRYGRYENKKQPTQPGQPFQHVSEAISQRMLPVPYERVEQRGVKSTAEEAQFLSKNTDCRSPQYSQNKLFFEGTKNQDKNNSQTPGSSENLFPNSISQNTQSKKCIETIPSGTENKNYYNSIVPTKHVDSGSQTSVLGYNRSSDSCNNPVNSLSTQPLNCLNNFENNSIKRCNDDFSVKDLLKIIAQQSHQISQQNEQLLLLQKQVSMLICQKQDHECAKQKSIQCEQERNCHQQQGKDSYERTRHCCSHEQQCEQQTHGFVPSARNDNIKNLQDRCITSTQHENCDGMKKKFEGPPPKTNKNNIANFSIGLTTSFEVSFRNPHYNKNPNDFQKIKQLPNFDQCEPPKIQEITETDSTQRQSPQDFSNKYHDDDNRKALDESMIFKEPIRVRESCPSPEPSIKINMNDFEDSESEDDTTSPELGPSFYRNLMVQVNKILQKAQIETTEEVAYNFKGQNLKQNTLHKVKEATLKHLRRIGVEVQGSEDNSESSNSSDELDSKSYNQDDISFAVKQLLMKYLPADHLAKVAYKEAQAVSPTGLTPREKIGAIKTRPDFSFATVQYMKKYNLIAKNHKDFRQAVKQSQPESPKILDITKLKQQPKLL